MKLKKLTVPVIMAIFLMVILAGCSLSSNTQRTSDDNVQINNTSEKNTSEKDTSQTDLGEITATTSATLNEEDDNKKILIVYYSASGNTKRVAEILANKTNGDLFELIPESPYTDADLNYSDDNSRIIRERDNIEERNVALTETTVDNWDTYDTILLGYPIWYGIAAWPVNSFVEANDFSGKTVIPFCTSSSSDLGDSGKLLEDLTGSGNWENGRRFSSSTSEEDVQEWVDELELAN